MNFCVLYGKIVSKVEFKFIIKSKNKAIAYFDMLLLNKSVVCVKAYNEIADYFYRNLNKNQTVIVEGKVRSDGTVECKNVKMALVSFDIFACHILSKFLKN